mmetsp:Transcript_27576/g.51167  ORF Transcript_27576/g.51167 Transcript_27576/m.51167 type:complete len:574 (+) Transcript_27576:2069-3790(+)
MRGPVRIGTQHTQTTHQHCHFRCGERQQLRPVHQQLFGRHGEVLLKVVAETIGLGLKHIEGFDIRLLLAGVTATGCERHGQVVATGLGRGLDSSTSAQHDQIGQRDLLGPFGIEISLDAFQHSQHFGQLGRLVHGPVFLRCQADARAIGTAPLVRPAIGRGRSPGGRDKLTCAEARGEDRSLEVCHIRVVDQWVIRRRDRVLPDQLFGGDFGPVIALDRPHVAVRQLEPSTGERVGKLVRIGVEIAADFLIGGVHPHRHVGGGHHDADVAIAVHLRSVVVLFQAFCLPLVGACRALGQLPIVPKEDVEIGHVPCGGCRRPRPFDARCDRINAFARFVGGKPAKAHRFKRTALRLNAHMGRVARTVRLAKGVTTRNQCHGFLIIHRHARKCFPDIATRGLWIRVPIRPFGVHIDQAHLDGSQRVFQLAVAGVAAVFATACFKPLGFRTPIDVFLGLPHVGTTAAKAERCEPHIFHRDIAREDHQVGPGNLIPVLFLDRPQQAARLVEVAIVGPGIQRRKALRTGCCTTTAICRAVCASRVPRHTHKERAIVTIVSRPPVLAVAHQGGKVGLQRL